MEGMMASAYHLLCCSDNLYDVNTTHWSGQPMPLCGLISIDSKVYRFMGPDLRCVCVSVPLNFPFFLHLLSGSGLAVPPLPQTSVTVFPTRTLYIFAGSGVQLNVTFTTPAFTDSQADLAMPVTYMTFAVASTDGLQHAVSLYYDNTAEVAVADETQNVTWAIVEEEK